MPATNEDFDPVKRGDAIRAEAWNKLQEQMVRLSNVGGDQHTIATGAGTFSRSVGKPSSGMQLAHGIVTARCDATCNTYRVRIIKRILPTTCDDGGSGSGS